MPAARKYRRRVPFTLNTEADTLNQFAEQCRKQGLTISERFTEFMREELEKNAVGHDSNPISITYGCQANPKSSNTLDYYLDNGFVTRDYWKKKLERDDPEKWTRVENLGTILVQTCKQLKYYNQTGRWLTTV